MDNISSEWIDAIQARLEARFPNREIRFLGQVGPMGHTRSVFTTKQPDGHEGWIYPGSDAVIEHEETRQEI